MRTRQISRGHQKLVYDLAARKNKSLFEKFCPFLFGKRMVAIKPTLEGAVFFSQFQNPLRVYYCCVDLQSIANDTRLCKQSRPIFFTIIRNFINIKTIIRSAKV